jgi:hypothetical protein
MRETPGKELDDNIQDSGANEAVGEVPESASISNEMTFGEMREALADENHPRHAEALQQGKSMSTKLGPAMEELKRSLTSMTGISQLAGGVKIPSISSLVAPTTMAGIVKATEPIISSADVPPACDALQFAPPVAQVPSFDYDEISDSFAEAAREKEARQKRQDRVAADSLEVLQVMAASIQQLDQRMGDVEQRLVENNTSAVDSSRKTINIASWTLFATVMSILATIILAVFL